MLHLPWYHAPWATIYLIQKCLATSSYKMQSLRMLITSALSRTVSEWWFYPAFFIAVSYLLTLASTLIVQGQLQIFHHWKNKGLFSITVWFSKELGRTGTWTGIIAMCLKRCGYCGHWNLLHVSDLANFGQSTFTTSLWCMNWCMT